jgi:hypothetical protein
MSLEARLAIEEYLYGEERGPSVAEIKVKIAEFVKAREEREAIDGRGRTGRLHWSLDPYTHKYSIREGRTLEGIKL